MKNLLVALAVVFACFAGTAYADQLTFYYGTYIPGDSPVTLTNTPPWLEATFAETTPNTPGDVTLTLSTGPFNSTAPYAVNPGGSAGLTTGESTTLWAFNLDPSLSANAGSMVITSVSGPSYSQATPGNYNVGVDASGYFCLRLSYAAGAFMADSTSVIDIKLAGLTANSFNFSSQSGGYNPDNLSNNSQVTVGEVSVPGHGNDYTTIPVVGSNNITTPEPTGIVAMLGLAGMGLLGLVWRRRAAA